LVQGADRSLRVEPSPPGRGTVTTKTERFAHAHEQSVSFSSADMARFLQDVLGQRLTAHIANVRDPRTVGAWAAGENAPRPDAEERLRLALQIVHLLQGDESLHVVRAWFVGLNPQLNDEAPASAIREGRYKEALTAARAFIAGG
jgi:hypothetical protein